MAGGIPITDPVELAWCEFARHRADQGIPVHGCGEQSVSIFSFKAGAEWERAACVEVARAAGCACYQLGTGLPEETGAVFDYTGCRDENGDDLLTADGDRIWPRVIRHSPRCPAAILAAIEARGRS
jgi:hypothetical protein